MAFTLLQAVGSTTTIPQPTTAKITYNDVSDPDAGRTENGQMQKLRKGTCVKIELTWQNVPTATGTTICTLFAPEYFNVTYYDVKTATARTAEFYAGDRGAAVYNAALEIWESITVNLIERTPA